MFYFLKPYNHLPGYMHRFSIFRYGKMHIRFHVIYTPDGTPYIHSHPFSYVSIILKGGYIEQVEEGSSIKEYSHKVGSFVLRKNTTYHRIKKVKGKTITLFIAWAHGVWDLKHHNQIEAPKGFLAPTTSGLYRRKIGEEEEYSFFDGVWRNGKPTKEEALLQTRPSIHQVVDMRTVERVFM